MHSQDKTQLSLSYSLHGPAIVWSVTLKQVYLCPRHTGDGSVPAVLDSAVHIACVEALKPNVKRHITLHEKVTGVYASIFVAEPQMLGVLPTFN